MNFLTRFLLSSRFINIECILHFNLIEAILKTKIPSRLIFKVTKVDHPWSITLRNDYNEYNRNID